MTRTISRRRLLFLGVATLVALLGVWLAYLFYWPNSFQGGAERVFFVSRGETFASIVDSLEAQGVIRSRGLFLIAARLQGGATHMLVGKYRFDSGVSNAEILHVLTSGKGNLVTPVTLPEGSTARLQARILKRAVGIDSARYMHLVNDDSLVRYFGFASPSLEGYLFPDTYNFYWEEDEVEVVKRLVERFDRFYSDTLQERARGMGRTTNQIITLASIVEGEARLDQERGVIAGVYYNRLRRGMPLKADPTIQHFISGGPRRVLYSDLQVDNPYNTYKYRGLPPGPVNNPGRASILAALYPVQNDYLYFVANGKGGHGFSRTFEEHKRLTWRFKRDRARSRTGNSQEGR